MPADSEHVSIGYEWKRVKLVQRKKFAEERNMYLRVVSEEMCLGRRHERVEPNLEHERRARVTDACRVEHQLRFQPECQHSNQCFNNRFNY